MQQTETDDEIKSYSNVEFDKREMDRISREFGECVYFLHFKEMNIVRIGTTTRLHGRMQDHRITLPGPVEVLKVVRGGVDVEAEVQHGVRQFYKENSGGSWYYLTSYVKEYIDLL